MQFARRLTTNRVAATLPPLGLAVATIAFVSPAVVHGIEVWSTDEEFSYGFLILPVALLIVWFRRQALFRSLGGGANAGLVLVAIGVLFTLLGRRMEIHVLGGLAVSPLLVGVVVYAWGWRAGRVMAFPIGFLEFGLALYRGLLNSLGFALQQVTAIGAAWAGHAVGLPVVRDGLVLQSPAFAFVVAQTCSGMSSLLSLLALATLCLYVTGGSLRGRTAVLLSVLPLVILANTLRVTLVLVVATWLGQDAALGFFHGASSLVLFAFALGGLLMVSRMVGCRIASFAFAS